MDKVDATQFVAIVQKVQTLADGGLRFTFDVSETEIMAAAELMEAKRIGLALKVVVYLDDNRGKHGKPEKRAPF